MAIAEEITERAVKETREDLRQSLRKVARYEEMARRERHHARKLAAELVNRPRDDADYNQLLGVIGALDVVGPGAANDPDVIREIETARTPEEHADAVARYERDFYRDGRP